MCYSNNNCGCGCGSGSCFSVSSDSCRNNSTGSVNCGNSGIQTLPYYVNPCGWYEAGGVALLAVVGVSTVAGNGCGRCGCCC